MQARLLFEREVLEFLPGTNKPCAAPQLLKQCVRRNGRLFAPAGTVIDDPNVFWIVLNGQAEAVDEECRERTKCSDAERQKRLHAAKRLEACIEPKDYELFDAGYITGYDGDGNYVPGPNWSEYVAKRDSEDTNDEGI